MEFGKILDHSGLAELFSANNVELSLLHNGKIDWKLAPISNEQATGYELSWTGSGKLAQRDAARHIYTTAADGSSRVRLLENDEVILMPTVAAQGTR